jgi:hypothetical protein
MMTRLLTQSEAAKRLRRSVATIARLRRAGAIDWLPGRPVMIPEESLNLWLSRSIAHAHLSSVIAAARKTRRQSKAAIRSSELQNSFRQERAIGKSSIASRAQAKKVGGPAPSGVPSKDMVRYPLRPT